MTSATYRIDAKQRHVAVKFPKKVNVAVIESYCNALRNNPIFSPNFSEIVDITEVEEIELAPDEMIRIADQVDPFAAEARRAFIVRTSVQNQNARMHKALRISKNLEVFRSQKEALAWIQSASGASAVRAIGKAAK
ncbi:MAG TPA: hypothetical protein VMH04_01905 [Candidatus Solibacter sp.]|nr:hypothetical protein [Candidatus Solibacter sp.]